MWFRKRSDAKTAYIVTQCGIATEFSVIGPVVHEDDLEKLRVELLDVSAATMSQLFEKTKI